MYRYVIAPPRLMYGKYSTRGGDEGKYSTRRSRVLYLPRDPTPSAVFFHISRVGGALTHLLFLCGRIISVILVYFVVMDSQCDALSQVCIIIGDALKVYLM